MFNSNYLVGDFSPPIRLSKMSKERFVVGWLKSDIYNRNKKRSLFNNQEIHHE